MAPCSIINCSNTTKKVNQDISFHRFPDHPRIKNMWIEATGRKNWFPTKHSRICSIHFHEDTFTGPSKFRRIISTAYPTIDIVIMSKNEKNVLHSVMKDSVNNTTRKRKLAKDINEPSTSDDGVPIHTPKKKRKLNQLKNARQIIKEEEKQIERLKEQNLIMDLYYVTGSPPCRVVLLVAAALDLQLNLKEIDLSANEHRTPEFLKLNPQHTVPTLVDGDFSVWESRAVSRYLIGKSKDKSLYPEDLKTRALVDQRLDFDLGTLYPRFAEYFFPQVFAGKRADRELLKKLEQALAFLDAFLDGHKYAVGETLTLADLSLVATVSTIDAAGISLEPYPRVAQWYKLVQATAPGYEEANEKGLKKFRTFSASIKAKSDS